MHADQWLGSCVLTLWRGTLPACVPAAYVHVGSDASKLLPIWKASTALFPSIYISSPETAKIVVESTVALSIKMAEQAAAPGKRRAPVYPFGWECCEFKIDLTQDEHPPCVALSH